MCSPKLLRRTASTGGNAHLGPRSTFLVVCVVILSLSGTVLIALQAPVQLLADILEFFAVDMLPGSTGDGLVAGGAAEEGSAVRDAPRRSPAAATSPGSPAPHQVHSSAAVAARGPSTPLHAASSGRAHRHAPDAVPPPTTTHQVLCPLQA